MTEDTPETGNEVEKTEEPPIQQRENVESDKMLDEIEKIEEVKSDSEDNCKENGHDLQENIKEENKLAEDGIDEKPIEQATEQPASKMSIFQRLFRKTKDDDEKKKDPEASKGLLSKSSSGKSRNGDTEIEIRDGEKSDKTDITAEIGCEKVDVENNADDGKPRVRTFFGVPRERMIIVFIVLVVFLIIATVVIGILSTSSGGESVSLKTKYVDAVTHCGLIRGIVEDDAIVFRGIPYAVPPVGPKRWKPSELVSTLEDCWTDKYKADNHTTLCYQKPLSNSFDDVQFSEDCLFLTVYTPRVTYDEPMSVVVYFAGDSFQGHDNMDFKWRPTAKLAKEKDVVFVVVHYRMNAFGFLALELLTKSSETPTSGNYGLHDMLTALRWVHRNIENFGGTTTKVTILGHGAGATGVLALISSRMGQLLFTQAWITGGSASMVNKTLREVERNNEAFNRHLMCDTVECLYSKTPEQILNAIPSSEWPFWGVPNHLKLPSNEEHVAAVPVIDGTILYDMPSAVWQGQEGDFVDVALVVGSSLDSVGSQLVDEDFENWDWDKFNSTVRQTLGTFGAPIAAEAIEKYYNTNKSAVEQYVRMVSDLRVTCPLLNLAYQASKVFSNNVYFYLSSYVPDSIVEYMNLSNQLAVHGLEVAAIFGRIPDILANPSPKDLLFQETVQNAFYNFVEHGKIISTTEHHNQKMPWSINWIYEEMKTTERYSPCEFWTQNGFYPRYARMN